MRDGSSADNACQLSSPTRRALSLNSWDLTSLEIGTGGYVRKMVGMNPTEKV